MNTTTTKITNGAVVCNAPLRDGYINLRVTIDGRGYDVGGAYIHSAESAARENNGNGLQPETHPNMRWPGAVSAGDLRPYTGEALGDLSGLCRALFGDDYTPEQEDEVAEALSKACRRLYDAAMEVQP